MAPHPFYLKTLLFAALWFLAFPVSAQTPSDQKILVVHPAVGEIIDLEEKVRFNLFTFADEASFQIARFVEQPGNKIVLEIIKRNGTTESRPISRSEFELTGQLIDVKAGTARPAPQVRGSSAPPVTATALPPGKVYYVILSDGMKFFATIAEKRPKEYVFTTHRSGTIIAAFTDIKYLKEVEPTQHRGAYRIPNPHDSRLYFGPTGRGIPQGEGYFQTIYGYINSANVGITNNFSIGTTFLLVPFVSLDDNIFSITPKLSFPVSEKTSVAAGALYTSVLGEQIGLLYGAGTYGSKDSHVTAGLGFGFFNDEISKTPVIMLGGVKRVSNRVALMSENYIVPVPDDRTYSAGLYGIRFIWPRTNLDIGGLYVAQSGTASESPKLYSSYLIPLYYSFTFKFGNRKLVGRAE